RWRKQFECNVEGSEDWSIPEDVRAQGSGWYFVRLYDVEGHLIDSLDFRYISRLQSIDLTGTGIRQALNEAQLRVTFAHNEEVSVKMVEGLSPLLEHATLRGSSSTVFAWPSDPNIRQAAFEVYHSGHSVRVTLETDKIWWAVVSGVHA